MANEFIARKGLISLGDSQITGSLETTSNLNVGGQAKIYNRNFIIGTQVTASGFPGNFEFQAGPSTYSSQFIIRPKGNPGGYNNNYWGTIRFNPSNEQGLTLLAGNYTTNILFGRGAPSSANPYAFAKLNNDGLRLQSSYIQSIASAEEKLHVVGNAKITGFVTASGNLITEANITASGHVSASTYYGDGSNLTSLPTQDPFPYTGSAIISGSLDVEGDTYIDGFITASDTIWSQNSGGIAFKLNGGAAVRNTGRFYLDAHDQFTIRPDLDGGGNKFVTIVGDLLLSNNTNGVPQDRLHVDGGTVITGSNSLAGNYALKVTNTSGADILNVENDGNVGIGIDNPTEKLHVHDGIVHISDSSTNNYIDIEPDVSGAPRLRFFDAGAKDYQLTFGGTGQFQFNNSIYISNTGGKLELEESNIFQKGQLQLRGTDTYVNFVDTGVAFRGAIGFLDNNADFIYTQGASTLAGGTEQFRIASSGNVGIGVTNPQTNLHVSSSVSASTYYGDGSNLTGITGISFNGSTANGLVTYGSATTADVESKLTFNSSTLFIESTNVGGGGIEMFAGTYPVANAYISPKGIFTTILFGSTSTGKIFDFQNNKIAFDSDSTNTYIQADTDNPENLEIHADGNIELRADDDLQVFSDVDITGDVTASGDLSISGFPSVSASLAAASGGGGSAYHTWIGGKGQNTSQVTYGTQWRGGMSGNSIGGSFVVNTDANMLTVSSGTPSVGDTVSADNYKIVTALIHPAMAFTTIEWYGHFRAYNSACDGNEQHMEIWTLDDVNDLAGFGTTTLTFRGGNQWTYDGTSSTIKPIITSGSISHTGTETTAFVVVSHVPTNPASSMQFVYKFDFKVT